MLSEQPFRSSHWRQKRVRGLTGLTTTCDACSVSFQLSGDPAGGLSVEALGRLGVVVLFTMAGMAMLKFICWVKIEKLQRCKMRAIQYRTEQEPERGGRSTP